MNDKYENSNEKLKNIDSSRFQTGFKGSADQGSANESSQGLEKQQEEEMEQGM
jgi:hypothetical protein